MKKVILILITLFGFGVSIVAQDIIILKNGNEIKSIVREIGDNYLWYKKWEDQAGGTYYYLKKDEVFMIEYENGSNDVFYVKPQPADTKTTPHSEPNNNYQINPTYITPPSQEQNIYYYSTPQPVYVPTLIYQPHHRHTPPPQNRYNNPPLAPNRSVQPVPSTRTTVHGTTGTGTRSLPSTPPKR